MAVFNFHSKPNDDGSSDIVLVLTGDDATGNLSGTYTYKGDVFKVTGAWAAAGSVADRNFNAMSFSGADSTSGTVFVAATGTFASNISGGMNMQFNALRVSTQNDRQYGWDGDLFASPQDNPEDDI